MVSDVFVVFFSSRRRHTLCALVTGVQTFALPILKKSPALLSKAGLFWAQRSEQVDRRRFVRWQWAAWHDAVVQLVDRRRSEARRVGKECVSTCRSRWSQYH